MLLLTIKYLNIKKYDYKQKIIFVSHSSNKNLNQYNAGIPVSTIPYVSI